MLAGRQLLADSPAASVPSLKFDTVLAVYSSVDKAHCGLIAQHHCCANMNS